jgi:hypothetical protein
MYQQQQQQQVFNRAVAMQNLNPFQQAAVGVQQAGYNLAGALGGALGGVDPQLQRISTLNAISKQIDQSNPESMLQGAKLLADAGFTQEAFGLANYARKANSELALAQQRMKEGRAAAIPKEVQIAEYTATLRNAIKQLEARPSSPETDNQIAELQGRLDALPQQKEATQNTDVFKAQRAGQIVNQLAFLEGLPESQQSPEAIRALKTELAVLSPTKETPQNAKIAEGLRIGELVGQIDTMKSLPKELQNPTAIRQLEAQLAYLDTDKKVSSFAQSLIDRGFQPGSLEFNNAMDAHIKKETTLPAKADATTNEIRNALAVADLSGFAKDTPEYNKVFKDELARLTAKPAAPVKEPPSVGAEAERISLDEFGVNYYALSQDQRKIVNQRVDAQAKKADRAPPSVGADAERISLEKFGKNYYDLTPDQRAAVNKIVDAKEPSGKVTITNVLPGTEKLVDIPAFRSSVQRTIEPQLKIIDATDTALAAIDDSIATNNFSSFRAAQTQFARAISGGGDLSQKELLAAGADPAILGGTADYLSKLVSRGKK